MGNKTAFIVAIMAGLAVLLYQAYIWHHERYSAYLIDDPETNARFGKIMFREVSPFGLITVGKSGNEKIMFVNYREMCSTRDKGKTTIASNILSDESAHHVATHAGQGDVLNIGLGCGMTAAHLAKFDYIRHLDVVEINPVIYKAAAEIFATENHGLADNPKVDVIIADGVQYLKDMNKRYDAIIIDIEEVSVIYSSPLYTVEYLQMIKDKLNAGGVVSMWSFLVSPVFQKTLYNTFKAVFPYVRIQFFEGSFNLYGSDQPIVLKYTPEQKLSEQQEEKIITMSDVQQINTLDHRALEALYNSNKNFNLPEDYTEEFVK